jgi:16S rRNA processing protein RimM
MVIMKIKGINTVEEAEKLKNKFMYVSREEGRELEEGEFFISDMIGIDVYTVDGQHVGVLDDVLQYAANDVYVIKGAENKEYMIPAMLKFVPTIDMSERKMIIDPIAGMLD